MVVGNFTVRGEEWVAVKLDGGTCTMPLKDWKRAYGYMHPERWKKR